MDEVLRRSIWGGGRCCWELFSHTDEGGWGGESSTDE